MFDRAEPHEYVAAFGAQAALCLFRLLPLDAASALGGWLGRSFGGISGKNKLADRQLAAALPELAAEARQTVLRGMWDNLGRVAAEYAHLDTLSRGDRIEVVGLDHVDALKKDGRTAIFFSAHFGNWEVMSIAAARLGVPLLQVYRAANNPLTEDLLQRLRAPVGGRHVPKGAKAAREILSALRSGESVAMLVDQKLNTGLAVPFFGRDAMTAPAIAELALRLDCPLVPARVDRLGGARFRVTVEEPFRLEKTGDKAADVMAGLRRINSVLETWIRARPDHWFWVHRRWPKT